jgi:uncharacterized membrane protein
VRPSRLWFLGAALALALLTELAIVALADVSMALGLAQMVGLEMLAGREAGIPVGLQAGAPPWLVVQVSFLQDMAAVCLLFPFALVALQDARRRGSWLGRRIAAVDAAARRHEAWAKRWGPLGVFAFMLIPFLSNGPLLAALLGRAAGIPPRNLVAPIVAATLLAIVGWTLAYERLLGLVGGIDPRLPLLLTATIVLAALTAAWVGARRTRT